MHPTRAGKTAPVLEIQTFDVLRRTALARRKAVIDAGTVLDTLCLGQWSLLTPSIRHALQVGTRVRRAVLQVQVMKAELHPVAKNLGHQEVHGRLWLRSQVACPLPLYIRAD